MLPVSGYLESTGNIQLNCVNRWFNIITAWLKSSWRLNKWRTAVLAKNLKKKMISRAEATDYATKDDRDINYVISKGWDCISSPPGLVQVILFLFVICCCNRRRLRKWPWFDYIWQRNIISSVWNNPLVDHFISSHWYKYIN